MKKENILWISLIALIVFACHKEPYINFGFNSEINKNSEGLVIKCVPNKTQAVYLIGELKLSEGTVKVELTRPDGSTAFAKEFLSPESIIINEGFAACGGCWTLKYNSNQGKGAIDLHLTDY